MPGAFLHAVRDGFHYRRRATHQRRHGERQLRTASRERGVGVARFVAWGTEWASKLSLGLFPAVFTFTRDQVELLKSDNVVSAEATAQGRTLQGLGIEPQSCEAIVPSYLYRFRKTGQFDAQRLA